MNGPLVDTSVLVDVYSGRVSPEADVLETLLADGPDPAVAPIILQEFLQGLSRAGELSRGLDYLQRFIQLPPPDYDLHERAAALQRDMRRQGATAGTVDALIVAIAETAGVPLLTSDRLQAKLCAIAGVVAL
jgi:predicted nucleic acid-binding protein